MSQLFKQYYASSVRLVVRSYRARTSRPRPNFVRALTSAPRDLTHLHAVCGLRLKLSAPMSISAYTRNCSDWRLVHFRGQPLQTANRQVGGQQ